MTPQNDNFSHFAKHWLLKNHYVATPLPTKNWCFYISFKKKDIDVEQKTEHTSRKTKKLRKSDFFERKEKTENKETERIDERQTLECMILMLFFA